MNIRKAGKPSILVVTYRCKSNLQESPMKHAVLAPLFALATTAAFAAAQPIGTLSSASGAVSVGGQGVIAQAKAGVQLLDGATIMTPSGANATVSLTEGCTIVLKANQHLTLNNKLTCGQLQSSIKDLMPSYKVAQAPVGGGLVVGGGGAAAGGGLLAGIGTGTLIAGGIGAALVINEVTKDDASPN
jgi:hypothetical protein